MRERERERVREELRVDVVHNFEYTKFMFIYMALDTNTALDPCTTTIYGTDYAGDQNTTARGKECLDWYTIDHGFPITSFAGVYTWTGLANKCR